MDVEASSTAAAERVGQLAGRRVLVVGDITLDEYLYGRATRLSREAPIPVLELLRREVILGGAANPARNVVALGSAAALVGIVGLDSAAAQLRQLLGAAQIADGLVTSATRASTCKTRVLADEAPRLPQQVARLDQIDRAPLDPTEEALVLAAIDERLVGVDALICSDYQTGLLTQRIVDTIRTRCRERGIFFAVDAQGNSHYYRGADLFRCNDREAAAALGRPLLSDADFIAGLAQLQRTLGAATVIVTRGPQGLSLVDAAGRYMHIPALHISEVYDTTGAGDTFIAAATLALATGLPAQVAATIANAAAALVVRRLGNAVVHPAELIGALQAPTR